MSTVTCGDLGSAWQNPNVMRQASPEISLMFNVQEAFDRQSQSRLVRSFCGSSSQKAQLQFHNTCKISIQIAPNKWGTVQMILIDF